MSVGHMFMGVEVLRSMNHHGVSFEGAWLGAERPEIHQQGERRHHWPPGRNVPWVRVHLCTVDPDACAAEGDLHIQRKDIKILIGPEELPDGEVRLSALDWLREWQQGVATVRESGRLYDEEATRASSAGPFVLPVARGSTEGAEVGQRLSVLESQILRDLEGGDQRSVKRRTGGVKGFALSAVPTPPLPDPGEEVVEQSRDSNATGSEIIIKSEARGCASSFQCNETKETASRREEGRSEDYGNSRHDFRGRKRRTRTETDSEGNSHSAPTRAQEEESQQRKQRRHKRIRHFEQRNSEGDGKPLKNNASCRRPARRADDVFRRSDSPVCDRRDENASAPGRAWPDDRRCEPRVEVLRDSPSRSQRKDQPWTARGAANTRGGARLSMGRAVRSCRRHTSSAVSSCRSQLRGADRMAPSSFHRSAPALADHISARGDACRDRQASTERVQVEWERCDRLADGERNRKRRMERDESTIDEQREKRRKRPGERSQAQRRQRERMEAGSSQSKWNNNSAPLKDWGPKPVSKSKTYDSQLAELEERFHKNSLDSPTAKVVLSPADDHEDNQAAVTAADGEEVSVIAIAPTRVWLGDLPQGVSLPPDCVYIGRNMGKHIRSVGWGNPFVVDGIPLLPSGGRPLPVSESTFPVIKSCF